ncbi:MULTISPECIES: hypothetical protein [Pseudomonas]|jgi:hypothetical protein|uniref:N-acetyltransferase domain-containing protein n=1 Tax=Pseudomonas lutea TaxID=243924 RepID=A0ABR9A5Y9_9PSED|nr:MULTISPECIES: hypothetical protein [Pseudomonas]MBD8121360.1 hypothetical protein [Pseudomonas lutea]
MPDSGSEIRCEKVDSKKFREALGEASTLALDIPGGSEVVASINTLTNMRANDNAEAQANVAYFVAYEGIDDAVGLMVMSKASGVWTIEDLFSGVLRRGLGTLLARYGMAHAIRDYGRTPNCEIRLISLDAASCAFWKKIGFVMLPGVASGHGGMVYRVSNSRPVTPV